MEFAIVDLQGFIYNGDFVVKEICILTKNLKFHEIVKSPFPFTNLTSKCKQEVKWLENNYHGLRWNHGYITQNELQKTIAPILKNKIIIVKGLNKIKWVQEILKQQVNVCINVEDMGCIMKLSEPFSNERIEQGIENIKCCNKHKFETNHCALRNALLIRRWNSHDSAF